jgi:hypothetical protein
MAHALGFTLASQAGVPKNLSTLDDYASSNEAVSVPKMATTVIL